MLAEHRICTGCGACRNACRAGAISMEWDREGFLFPIVDEDICVKCGLCEKACPLLNKTELARYSKPKVFRCWNNNTDMRLASSSGGVFSALAQHVIRRGGVVFGAGFDENFDVRHCSAESAGDIAPFRGSKYIQSDTLLTYREAKKFLLDGRTVLYSGTPCQIDGLYSYLGGDRENLITCDFVCHGVSSRALFHDIVNYLAERYGGKPVSIRFRDKVTGCMTSSVAIDFENGKSYRDFLSTSLLTYGFATALTNREQCCRCPYASLPRVGDLTLSDYSNADAGQQSRRDRRQGMSLLFLNSAKAMSIRDNIAAEMHLAEVDLRQTIAGQPKLSQPPLAHPRRSDFFADYLVLSLEQLIGKHLTCPGKIRWQYRIGPSRVKKIKSVLRSVRRAIPFC